MLKTLATMFVCAAMVPAQDLKAAGAETKKEKVPSSQAPPEVDAALRSRVSQFFQAHVDGKYRVADQVVAEESKDAYFAMAKPKFESFEIINVEYSDNFSKADVLVGAKGVMTFHRNAIPVTMPKRTAWKLIDGQWFWYVPAPTGETQTAFGVMHTSPRTGDGSAPRRGLIPGDPKVLAEQILTGVKTDTNAVELPCSPSGQATVTIRNESPGTVNLSVRADNTFAGLVLDLDPKSVAAAGGTATLTVKCDAKDQAAHAPLTAQILVDPTGQVLDVKVTFKP